MKALIDADILRYEIGFGGQLKGKDGGVDPLPFDYVADKFDRKIEEILEYTWGDEPILYLTVDKQTARIAKIEYKENFRVGEAKTKPYKGNRKDCVKPFHYENLTLHILSMYNCKLAIGYEADDLISIHHNEFNRDGIKSVICTRDKDLRMTEGYHFGWACGKQDAFGPKFINRIGYLELDKGKLKGGGLKFFFSQLLTGDSTDNIGGIYKFGPVKAFKLLSELNTEKELFNAVYNEYVKTYGMLALDLLIEQINLLYICNEYNEDGTLKLYDYKQFLEVDNA